MTQNDETGEGANAPGLAVWGKGGMMPQQRGQRLSLAEWLVLCLISEGPTHGFAIAGLLAQDGSLGQVWHVRKTVVYRAAQRLERLGLITVSEKQPSRLGPARAQLQVTPEGRQAAEGWLRQPVGHPRDIRSELMVKLALLDRAGADPADLLRAQRGQLVPIADALGSEMRAAAGYDRVLAVWRHESVLAVLRFVDALLATVPAQRTGAARG
jgi:DNA-binding PadR family transcriptional regulator